MANTLIVGCPEGAAIVASRWRLATGRRGDLKQLLTWHQQLMDQRIADAAIAAASDANRPTPVRLAALQVLVSYFDPSLTVGINLGALDDPPKGRTLAAIMDFAPRTGAQPPAPDLPGRVYALNRKLASDADPAVAQAARYLWQGMTDARPKSAAGLPSGVLTLENVCEATFRITNHADIDFSIELVAGERKRELRLTALATRQLVAPDTGIVRLRLNRGPEMASARTGQSKCP